MKKFLAAALCLLCILSSARAELPIRYPPSGFHERKTGVAYGEVLRLQYFSQTIGKMRNVLVILPADYTEEKVYPVLYLLHGSGGDENEWLRAMPVAILGNLMHRGEAAEMILVLPNIRARFNDAANPEDAATPAHYAVFDYFINDLQTDLMPFIADHFPIAKGRENTAIAGFSIGGKEALYIGLTMPDAFGAIGAFCPSRGLFPFNGNSGLLLAEDLQASKDTAPYILINVGTEDRTAGDYPFQYAQTLKQSGFPVTFYKTAGGHETFISQHGLYNFLRNLFPENIAQ